MLPILVNILVGLIVLGLIYWVITQIPLPPPIQRIATVVVVVIAAIWLIYLLMGLIGSVPALR